MAPGPAPLIFVTGRLLQSVQKRGSGIAVSVSDSDMAGPKELREKPLKISGVRTAGGFGMNLAPLRNGYQRSHLGYDNRRRRRRSTRPLRGSEGRCTKRALHEGSSRVDYR